MTTTQREVLLMKMGHMMQHRFGFNIARLYTIAVELKGRALPLLCKYIVGEVRKFNKKLAKKD